MKKPLLGKIPQIVAILPVKTGGKLRLVKSVKDYLGLEKEQSLYLDNKDEILLTTGASNKPEIAVDRGGSLFLPEAVIQQLELTESSLVGLVQRPNAVAVKKVEIEEISRDKPRLVDIETPTKIVRRVEVPPMPDDLICKLHVEYAALQLHYDIKDFVKGRSNLAAWKTRQMLDCADPSDVDFCQKMIKERFAAQEENGSWSENVILTARNLRELAELGVDKKHEELQRAAAWLMDRSQSVHNPGMFFAADPLVKEQAEVAAQRKVQKQGTRPRFRQIKTSEKKHIMSGDDLIYAPCGPRIMWPNGLTMEALLALGYEDQERMQTLLETLTSQDWCECGYQNGAGAGVGRKPLAEDALTAFEASCIAQYRYNGLLDSQELKQADMAHRTFAMRVAQVPAEGIGDGENVFILGMPDHIQGCEFITTRSLSQVRDSKARRFAEAHLWRFASRQYAADGTFPSERYGTGFHQAGILQAIARYDHPVVRVIILRALPWIVQNQNADGSWGEGERKDAETCAIIYALLSVRELLPPAIARAL